MLILLSEASLTHLNFEIFNVRHLEKVCANVRRKLSCHEGNEMKDVEVSGMIWEILMSATIKAAVHLGPKTLRTTKNTDFEQLKTHFAISRRIWSWIAEVKLMGSPRSNGIPFHGWDRLYHMTDVYSDSMLFPGKMHDHPTAVQKWEEQIGSCINSKGHQELCGIDGEPVEFEWNNIPGTQHWNCSTRFRWTWHKAESNQKNLEIGASWWAQWNL